MIPRIAAVVILFNPEESVIANIQTYIQDVETLYIFDNSPSSSKDVMRRIECFPKIQYLTENKNVGIGTALNIAAKKAIEEHYDYFLTMDQDSAAGQDMVKIMLSVANKYSSIGIVTPLHKVQNDILVAVKHEEESVLTAMTSGNLIQLAAYNKIGGFNEKLFIDYIDHEYCLRLHINGFSVMRANKAVLLHKVGDLMERNFFGIFVHPTNHNPARLYYQTRNRFYLKRLYGKNYPEYFKKDRKAFWKSVLKILLYEKHRLRKVVMICRGFIALWRNDFSSVPIL
jgi:rhamnosyltransferase